MNLVMDTAVVNGFIGFGIAEGVNHLVHLVPKEKSI